MKLRNLLSLLVLAAGTVAASGNVGPRYGPHFDPDGWSSEGAYGPIFDPDGWSPEQAISPFMDADGWAQVYGPIFDPAV